MPKETPHQRPETRVIRSQTEASPHREHASSIYMTSSFRFESAEHARALFAKEVDGSIYSRYSNPSVDEFVERMCILEDAEDGVAVASGMSAVFTGIAGHLNAGDHIIASRSVFGSSFRILNEILPRWQINTSFTQLTNKESWEAAIQPNTKLCYVETPSNPALDLVDLKWLGQLCKAHNILFYVDNIFATPLLQQPMHLGADLVMHSTTKFIDGQGRGIGGVIVGTQKAIEPIRLFARHTGPSMSPFNAWMFSRSLELLPVRMKQHCENAMALAEFLEGHPSVSLVKYPYLPSHPQHELAKKQMSGGGAVVTFEAAGGLEQGRRFLDALEMCSLTANLGDARTIATHPASTTHSSLTDEQRAEVGITSGLIRISVGLEAIDDIVSDIEQALEQSN